MDEQEIREAAYLLWEKQGKPQGKDLENWFTAEHLGDSNKTDTSDFSSTLRTSSENEPNEPNEPGEEIQKPGGTN